MVGLFDDEPEKENQELVVDSLLEHLRDFFRIPDLDYSDLIIGVTEGPIKIIASIEVLHQRNTVFGLISQSILLSKSGLSLEELIKHFKDNGSHVKGWEDATKTNIPLLIRRRSI